MALEHLLPTSQKSTDTILFLIAQELKIRRVFDSLQMAGFDDCFFEPYLGTLILAEIGLDDGTDETMNFYCSIIDRRSKKIKQDPESIAKQSLKVYMELAAEKAKRRTGNWIKCLSFTGFSLNDKSTSLVISSTLINNALSFYQKCLWSVMFC